MLKTKLIDSVTLWWQQNRLPLEPISNTGALRKFAWQFSVLLCLVFMGLLPWLFASAMPFWPLYVSGYLVMSQLIYPRAVYPVYYLWNIIATVLGVINTYILLTLLFVVLITPMGLWMRMRGTLDYQRLYRQRQTTTSYYKKRDALRKDHLTRPF